MKIFMAQCNPIIGDLAGNCEKIKKEIIKANDLHSELIVFSECITTGYPPKDLLLYPSFIKAVHDAIEDLSEFSSSYPNLGIIIGTPFQDNGRLYNAALLIYNGEIKGTVFKTHLPDYDVFQETRYFESSSRCEPLQFKDKLLGLLICEDAWTIPNYDHIHSFKAKADLAESLVQQGADILIIISASPFEVNKMHTRHTLFSTISKTHGVPLVVVNQVGANDDLIFDGGSSSFTKTGELQCQFPFFREYSGVTCFKTDELSEDEQRYHALVLGIRDYVRKSSFTDVVIGLSGGIDSAVTCALAVDALGAEHVRGITMPSMYSSTGSVDDSMTLAQNLGIVCDTINIKPMFDAYEMGLSPLFKNASKNVAEENIQARIRGDLLMAVSNKYNALVLTTGNKSELAVGYCTLYGDMCGALAVLSDVYKTDVYTLAEFLNKDKERIPLNTITKAPSAELRPDQKDQDSLPDYAVLDAVLKLHLEYKKSISEISDKGFDVSLVNRVLTLVKINEYKRSQGAIGLKLSQIAFGSGWRFPVVAKTLF